MQTTDKNYWGAWGGANVYKVWKKSTDRMINHLALKQKQTCQRRRNVKGKKSKVGCEQNYYCNHHHITTCGQRMSVGLIVAT